MYSLPCPILLVNLGLRSAHTTDTQIDCFATTLREAKSGRRVDPLPVSNLNRCPRDRFGPPRPATDAQIPDSSSAARANRFLITSLESDECDRVHLEAWLRRAVVPLP